MTPPGASYFAAQTFDRLKSFPTYILDGHNWIGNAFFIEKPKISLREQPPCYFFFYMKYLSWYTRSIFVYCAILYRILLGFCQKQVYLVTLMWCQKQVHSKTVYKTHARTPAIGQSTWFSLLCLALKQFWRVLSQSGAIH